MVNMIVRNLQLKMSLYMRLTKKAHSILLVFSESLRFLSLITAAPVTEGFLCLYVLFELSPEQCLYKMLLDGLLSKSSRSPMSSDRNLMAYISHITYFLLNPKRGVEVKRGMQV